MWKYRIKNLFLNKFNWADKHVFDAFQNGTPLIDIGDVKQGLATADNNRFLRLWYEVDSNNIGLNYGSCDESKNSNLIKEEIIVNGMEIKNS